MFVLIDVDLWQKREMEKILVCKLSDIPDPIQNASSDTQRRSKHFLYTF